VGHLQGVPLSADLFPSWSRGKVPAADDPAPQAWAATVTLADNLPTRVPLNSGQQAGAPQGVQGIKLDNSGNAATLDCTFPGGDFVRVPANSWGMFPVYRTGDDNGFTLTGAAGAVVRIVLYNFECGGPSTFATP
jgi:hypothetical protein